MVELVPLRDLVDQLTGPPAVAVVQVGGNLLVFAALGFFAPIRFAALSRPTYRLKSVELAGAVRFFTVGVVPARPRG